MAGQGKNDTDLALAQSIKELVFQRPFEKITIKEITDRAGVIRPTFYNHFKDKYDLLEWIVKTELLEPMRPLLRISMVQEAMVLLFTNIEKEKAFYTRVVKMEGPITFSDVANKCVQEMLLEILTEMMAGKQSKYSWLTAGVLSKYYAQSMCFVALDWIENNLVVPPTEMAEVYQYIITRSLEDVIEDM